MLSSLLFRLTEKHFIHLKKNCLLLKLSRSVKSKVRSTPSAFWNSPLVKEKYLSCPAVSQIFIFKFYSFTWIVLENKSIPIVGSCFIETPPPSHSKMQAYKCLIKLFLATKISVNHSCFFAKHQVIFSKFLELLFK